MNPDMRKEHLGKKIIPPKRFFNAEEILEKFKLRLLISICKMVINKKYNKFYDTE